MEKKIQSGKEILEDFFANIEGIKNVNKELAKMLSELYKQQKLTDTNLRNQLQKLRDKNASKN